MAGHSKWANIKRRKGAQDIKRGKVFGKLIREITVAARMGDPDPEMNPRLRLAVDKAKANSMPKDNIERAIAKASGEGGGESYDQITYEGYGPGGVAILVQCLTDNRNRTASEIRHAFSKEGGNMGQAGSVAYLFQRKGLFNLPKEDLDEETVLMAALEGSGEDVSEEEDEWQVTAAFEDYFSCMKALEELGVEVASDVTQIPDNEVAISGEDARKLVKLLDRLEDLDDVQETWTNADINEADLED
ncbi:MAG: YebC/PmpR family DNA-binding transcriptional regulator [Deltaproteobacteria bacterium]|nr:YebC/PmpR family DNA-binding transcriptional regulator [Deltaproteobacteria bacterium]MBW2253033.1 YebC/PmpR family DNA-binding transcriptional regulator [Deltaproteobacteria bacterium]